MREDDLDEVLSIERSTFQDPWSRASFLHELRDSSLAHLIAARTTTPSDQLEPRGVRRLRSGQAAFHRSTASLASSLLVGYACLWVVAEVAHITNIATHTSYRRRGIGSRLLRHALRVARKHHCEAATLEVRPSNTPALQLYERFGFQNVGRRKRYYREYGEDALIMELDSL